MSWLIFRKHPEENKDNVISSHLKLKCDSNNNTGGTLDKQVVLRRIRHRKRVNKFRSMIASFFPSTKNTTAAAAAAAAATADQDHDDDDDGDTKDSPVHILQYQSCVDDPFVAP